MKVVCDSMTLRIHSPGKKDISTEIKYEIDDNDLSENRWPGGLIWIDDNLICSGDMIDGMIEALQYIRDNKTNKKET